MNNEQKIEVYDEIKHVSKFNSFKGSRIALTPTNTFISLGNSKKDSSRVEFNDEFFEAEFQQSVELYHENIEIISRLIISDIQPALDSYQKRVFLLNLWNTIFPKK